MGRRRLGLERELRLIQSFLQFNDVFEVVFGVCYMLHQQIGALSDAFPGWRTAPDRGGAALWLRRRA